MALRILVVEDSYTSRRMTLSRMPKDQEFEIVEAENGEEALGLYQQARPDLVLLDLTMPVMDGYQFLRQVISLDPTANVVVLTADVQRESMRRCLEIGAKAVIHKPAHDVQLREVIRAYARR